MNLMRALGIAAVIAGIGLLAFGYNASNAPMEQVSETLTGRFTDRTTWLFILGAAAVAGGVFLTLSSKRS